jgi:hypothetical protein
LKDFQDPEEASSPPKKTSNTSKHEISSLFCGSLLPASIQIQILNPDPEDFRPNLIRIQFETGSETLLQNILIRVRYTTGTNLLDDDFDGVWKERPYVTFCNRTFHQCCGSMKFWYGSDPRIRTFDSRKRIRILLISSVTFKTSTFRRYIYIIFQR